MGNFHVKTQKSTDFAHTFSKNYSFLLLYFLIKIIVFYTKNLFIRPKNYVQIIFYNEKYKKFRKNQFFSNIFTFLSVIRQNLEDNLRILANFGKFSVKIQKSMDFAHTFSKKLQRFLFFLINIILFTLKIYSFGRKIAFKAFCTTKDVEFRKNQSFSNIFTFLSVIRQNFEDNLRILANFGKFSRKNSKIYGFRPYVFKKLQVFFLYFLIKIIVLYTKNLFIGPKNCVQIIFYIEKYKKFRKNQFFSNIFTFLSVIRQNFEDNLRILANFGKFSRKNSKIYGFCPYVLKKLQVFIFIF